MKKLIYLAVSLLLVVIVGCSNPGDSIIGPGSTVDSHQSLSADDSSQQGDSFDSLRESSEGQNRERSMDPWAGAERHGHGAPLLVPNERGLGYCGPR